MDKKNLSERDICTKFITPAIVKAGWNIKNQVREEVSFTDGRIIVQGKLYTRQAKKSGSYLMENSIVSSYGAIIIILLMIIFTFCFDFQKIWH